MIQQVTDDAREQVALARDRLLVHFQPIVGLVDGRVVALEALLRSSHPTRGLMTASELFGLLVNVPLRAQLADRALTLAADAWADLHHELGDDVPDLHVNLDPSQLETPDLVERIGHLLVVCDLPAERLVLEITDPDAGVDSGAGFDRAAAFDRTVELASRGVRLALDQFGSSSAALGWLREPAIAIVKVDPILTSTAISDDRSRRLLDHLVGMCGELGITPIASGLETQGQVDVALHSGMRVGQGFAVGRPVGVDDLPELIGPPLAEHR